MNKKRFVDILNILLFALLITTILLKYFSGYFKKIISLNMVPIKSPETISNWGRSRNFPQDFSEDEKLILTEQKHDYERLNNEDEVTYQKFLGLMKSFRSNSNTITLIKHNGDCFAQPVLVNARIGQEFKVVNTSNEYVNIGMGNNNWTIAAGSTMLIRPEFLKSEDNQIYWGYSCSDLGLAGYFVIDK